MEFVQNAEKWAIFSGYVQKGLKNPFWKAF